MPLFRVFFIAFLLSCCLLGSHPILASPSCSGIIINLPSRTLGYFYNHRLVKEYPVAIGSASTPTPLGTFHILDKEINPTWYPPGKDYSVSSGPANPLGYRWMGFLPTYGIHGTNMPWSIGSVTSNGCIRMFESDVEELFVMADYQTPIQITYDRIKIQIENDGKASIGIYPDVYGYQSISLADIQHRLTTNGLDGLADDRFLTKLLNNQSSSQIFLAQVYNLEVNGTRLNEHAAAINGTLYAPVTAVAELLNANVDWDEENNLIISRQLSVPGLLKGHTLYTAADNITLLFGGSQKWNEEGTCLILRIPTLFFAGQAISSNVPIKPEGSLVPALAVAKALQQKVYWDAERQVLTNTIRKIPITVINGEPYVTASRLGEFFNAAVQWDEESQVLDLIYPWTSLDLSMYLDWMGECID